MAIQSQGPSEEIDRHGGPDPPPPLQGVGVAPEPCHRRQEVPELQSPETCPRLIASTVTLLRPQLQHVLVGQGREFYPYHYRTPCPSQGATQPPSAPPCLQQRHG